MELRPADSLDTVVVHAGRPTRSPGSPLNTPIVPASSFHAGGPFSYAREEAPTTRALEDALGAVEGGIAVAFASGMAASAAVLDPLRHGSVVVAPTVLYSGAATRLRELAEAGRIELRTVDITDSSAVAVATTDADLLWIESPTNPLLDVADIPACVAAAHSRGAAVLVDNTIATPVTQRPLELGADAVLHSVTKAIGGHSDLLGGAVVVRDPQRADELRHTRELLGGVPSAFDSYLALRGLRTLALRVERAQQTARELSDRLREHPAVGRVRYPGFAMLAAIEVAGGAEAAEAVCEAVRLWTHATSLGGVESTLERRRRWSAESDRVPDNLIRLSFGIESPADLWRDLDHALRATTST